MSAIEKHIAVYRQALDLRVQRHQVLASNIANADTPNYKARDFDFSQAMQNARLGRQAEGVLPLAMTAKQHLAGAEGSGPVKIQFRNEHQAAVDGNTVEMDVERSEMTENALQYQVLTQLISMRLQGLRTAMSSTQG